MLKPFDYVHNYYIQIMKNYFGHLLESGLLIYYLAL